MESDDRASYFTVLDFVCKPKAPGWASGSDMSVYQALRSYTSGDLRSDGYGQCWPGIAGIAERAAVRARTVQESLGRWEAHGFIYRKPRRRDTTRIWFVVFPDMIHVFEAAQQVRADGDPAPLADAIHEHEMRLDDLRTRKRHATAAGAAKRAKGRRLDRQSGTSQDTQDRQGSTSLGTSRPAKSDIDPPLDRQSTHQDWYSGAPDQEVMIKTTTQLQPNATQQQVADVVPVDQQVNSNGNGEAWRADILARLRSLKPTPMPAPEPTDEEWEARRQRAKEQAQKALK